MIRTYVTHGNKNYLVSTINRDSSALYADGMRYAETMVWEWDAQTRSRASDRILMQGEGPEGSIYTHQKVVEQIFNHGIPA